MDERIIPQPEDLSSHEKDDAMGAYLMVFAALHIGLPLPFAGLGAAAIYHALNGKKSPFTGFHTFQALILSIPTALFSVGWMVWGVMLLIQNFQDRFTPVAELRWFWWFTLFNVGMYLLYVVVCIVGAVRARRGRLVYFPGTGVWAFRRYFGPAASQNKQQERNEPPKGY